MNFRDDNRDSEQDRTVVIRGTPEAAQQAEIMIRKIIAEIPEIFTEEMRVPGKCLGRIIGNVVVVGFQNKYDEMTVQYQLNHCI